jgi:2-dehydro-3-deoxyphosphogluconate aldolase/(4S)-4-hydroxy-2-oxoglutarate aldolase
MSTARIKPPSGVVAVIRTVDPTEAEVVAIGLAQAGISTIEITLTIPHAVDVIRHLRDKVEVTIGAGTVRDAVSARACLDAGAQFLVSPNTVPGVIEVGLAAGVGVIAGGLTPTEVAKAWDMGVSAVKVFPVNAVGGASYIRSLAEPLPDVLFVVSGGITISDVRDYLMAGCSAVCLGPEMVDKNGAATRDTEAIAKYARRVLTGVPGFTPSEERV